MAVEIKIPSVGESITDAVVSRWLKKDGDTVRVDEPIVEVETDKATGEIAAPASGTLHIATPAGQTVAIGSVVGQIDEKPVKAQPAAKPPKPDGQAREKPKETQPATKPDGKAQPKPEGPQASGERQPPVVAQEVKEPSTEGLRPPLASERETRQPMTAIRQRIAERLVASQKTTASLTTFNEADMSAVISLRNQYKEEFQKKHGVSLGFMSFFVKAAVEALRAFPIVNARIDGSDIVHQNYFNIGVAVSTERGLMVPVVRDADRLSFAEIEKTIAELAEKARDGKIAVGDLQGGTFTITNGGLFGSMLSTPILNPPQSAILGMHAIQKRPVAVNDQIVIRPMMYLALTYDHRLIDGRDAVLFLVRVKECIENPGRLLLRV
jgi:2-oxoglutarate dehydrogenase E2 component (dihydrolipoamide succinyltransferase)